MTACHELDRWLDAGRPPAEAPARAAHAAECARCSAAIAAMDALESALRAAPGARAPDWLAAAVLREVRAAPRAAPSSGIGSRAALVWWTLAGLATGGVGWGVVALLDRVGLPAAAAGWPVTPDLTAPLAAVSALVAAGLTWASLRLARAFDLAVR